uniref:Fibronectin type-III domain-containing protein n=1 Tax=Cuerna arida TaxID=1464854 RepID=A0A1B6G4V3_9HEMI
MNKFGILSLLVCYLSSLRAFSTDEHNIKSPLRVAQCRANCLERFFNDEPQHGESMCLQGPDCFMCWENCELLQSNFPLWGSVCEEKEICFPGCQEACRFHAETSKQIQIQPVIHTRDQGVITISGPLAKWPRPHNISDKKPLIYIVMQRTQNGPWRQIIQTLGVTTRVPISQNNLDAMSTLRVLVVDSSGLVAIYSPDEKSLFRESKKKRKQNASDIEIVNTSIWNLHKVSLIHQKVLVIGEIAWNPLIKKGMYLVTWEVDGGGLKGNLFTDSTHVTLSLWPETVYHIQVELMNRTGSLVNQKSAVMDLDTGTAQKILVPNATTKLPLSGQMPDVFRVRKFEEVEEVDEVIFEKSSTIYLDNYTGVFFLLLVILCFLVATSYLIRLCCRPSLEIPSEKLVEEGYYQDFEPVFTDEKPHNQLYHLPATAINSMRNQNFANFGFNLLYPNRCGYNDDLSPSSSSASAILIKNEQLTDHEPTSQHAQV